VSAVPTLGELRALAAEHAGLVVDASIGSPVDPPPSFVPHVLACQGTERAYPPAAGTADFLAAGRAWIARRFGVALSVEELAPTTGSKEAIGTLAWLLAATRPGRTVVVVPRRAYPTYAEGARAAGLAVVRVEEDAAGVPDWESVPAATWERTLLAYVNSPANPTGATYELGPAIALARRYGAVLVSDEAYADFAWEGAVSSALAAGTEGVLALFSLSKRSNLAGLRVGLMAGDARIVGELVARRRALGLLASGPSQSAAGEALGDEAHVRLQRERYRRRLERLGSILARELGEEVVFPAGGIYLWVAAPDGDGAALARRLASGLGLVVSPGETYGDPSRVRVAATVKDQAIDELEQRGGDR